MGKFEALKKICKSIGSIEWITTAHSKTIDKRVIPNIFYDLILDLF
jgi:hypothetical protein